MTYLFSTAATMTSAMTSAMTPAMTAAAVTAATPITAAIIITTAIITTVVIITTVANSDREGEVDARTRRYRQARDSDVKPERRRDGYTADH